MNTSFRNLRKSPIIFGDFYAIDCVTIHAKRSMKGV